jgi:aminoacylase
MGTLLDTWCQECSSSSFEDSKLSVPRPSVTWKYIGHHGNDLQQHATTSIDPTINPWFGRFTSALTQMGLEYTPQVFPAATDSRFLRAMGIHALGFSPMRNSPILLHENDEYIDESVFVEGIGVYVGLLETLITF